MFTLNNKRVLIFGDSIMFGSGNNGYGVGEYLRDHLQADLGKYAIGGARVGFYEGKSWVVDQVKLAIENNETPDYIVFDGMTNDCNMTDGVNCDVALGVVEEGYPEYDIFKVEREGSTFSGCFQAIIYTFMARFPRAKLLYVRTHNMGRRKDDVQKIYGERALAICEKWGVPYVDLYKESGLNTFISVQRDLFTNDSYNWGRGDCTHPNALGYELKYMPLIESKLSIL